MPFIHSNDVTIEIDENELAVVAVTDRERCSRSRFISALRRHDPAWRDATIHSDRWCHVATLKKEK